MGAGDLRSAGWAGQETSPQQWETSRQQWETSRQQWETSRQQWETSRQQWEISPQQCLQQGRTLGSRLAYNGWLFPLSTEVVQEKRRVNQLGGGAMVGWGS